ncbi:MULTISPECIES: DUF5719 family protein [unclassified Microbacterium]|uniref:DUF5719 family protein n=1 Tax=unclassified Microbacterium TaxID=2609290 RepID=UPI003017B1C0
MSVFSPARAARVALGVLLAAATLVGAAALVLVEPPGVSRSAVSVSAQPPASASVAACVGPLLASGRDSAQAAQLADAAGQSITSGASAGEPVEASPLAAADVSAGSGPAAVVAQPSPSGERTDLAAAGSSQVAAADLAGFAASSCARPVPETWLVGGAATTGASDLVLLANPGDVPALVTLTVYGATGMTAPAAGKGIVVPARTQRVIPLASLAIGEESPVVHVLSSQAPVRAALQTSLTRILVPGGVDQVGDAGSPATSLVIPGVPVTVPPGDEGSSNVTTSVRLLSPSGAGTATVEVQGSAGAVQTQTVPLLEGVPLRLDLAGLAVGTYTVRVSSTTPVTGAAWATTGFGSGSDFAWFTPAQPLRGSALLAVAAGPAPVVTLASSATEPQTVTLSDSAGGDPQQVVVPAASAVTVPVSPDRVYLLSGDGAGVAAAVTYAAPGAVAGYVAQPGDAAAASIVVYPR